MRPDPYLPLRETVTIGEWLFRHRTWFPVPIAVALLTLTTGATTRRWITDVLGPFLVVGAESLRLWGVRHIGTISRTRSERMGPLIENGPFQICRNPLYLGNMILWSGLAVTAGLLWMLPIIIVALGLQYHAIVGWEESMLAARYGDRYHEYVKKVPRFWPDMTRLPLAVAGNPRFSWQEALFSERGTLIALVAGIATIVLKRCC